MRMRISWGGSISSLAIAGHVHCRGGLSTLHERTITKRVCFDNEGTPRRHRRSIGRRLALTHGDSEVYSSPTLVKRPLAF